MTSTSRFSLSSSFLMIMMWCHLYTFYLYSNDCEMIKSTCIYRHYGLYMTPYLGRSFFQKKKEEDQKGSYQPSMHYYNSSYTHLFMWLCLILLLRYLQSWYGNTFLTIIIMIIPSYNITSPKKSLSVHRKEVVKQVVRRRAHCWFFG